MEESAWTRYETRAEDLLSAMSDEDAKSETKTPHKMRWQQILVTCCCLLAIAATAKAFLYLNTEMNTVAKNLNTLQARITVPDTKEQLAAVTAEIKDLKATNTQLRADVKKIRDTLEALRAKKTTLFLRNENGGPSQG